MTAIPSYGFNGCDYLETVYLPQTLTEIKNHAFYNCKKLKNIEIPESVTGAIGKSAFCYCGSLEQIELPEGTTELKLFAFAECTSLKKVILPDSIEKIGYRTFYGCKALSDINIPLNWIECPSRDESTINVDHCGQIFQGCVALTEITVPEGMTAIPSYGFNGCDYLETVYLPQTLTEIKNHTFYNCKKLKSIEIPESVTGAIGKSAFCYCSSLGQVELPDGITELNLYAFYECTSLYSVVLSENLKSIGDYAFYYCTGLKAIDLKNVDQLGEYTFSKSGLTEITIENMSELGYRAFENCKSLDEINFNAESYTLTYNTGGYSMFTGCGSGIGNIKVTIGPRVTFLSALFAGCSNLTDIIIPDNVTKIGTYTFYGCNNLKNVDMSKQLTTIEEKAFANCSTLDKIAVNSDITVASNSFSGAQMNELTLGKDVTSLESAFYQQIPIGNFEVDEENGFYVSDCGVLYDKAQQTLLCFPNKSNMTKCSIPESVTVISDYAFYNNSVLEEIDFVENSGTDVVMMALTTGGLSIGKSAFQKCTSIKEVTMPESLQSMGNYAMADCSSLEAVHFKGDAPELQSNAFQNDYVALGYRNGTTGWSEETFKSDMAKNGVVIVNEDEEYDRVCILVLDHSWSMDGDPLSKMKTAAKTFCNNTLNKMKYKTAVCIVPFCGTSKAYGFSSDKDEISNYIDTIECDNSTNIYNAAKASSVFLKYVNAKEKNIMLMTDGMPIAGETDTDGPYSSSDSTYYKYANAVYNYVKSLNASYRIFTIGFFSELNESEQKFAKKFLGDLSTHGYYDVTEMDDVITRFEEIAAGINGDTYLNMKESECAFYFYDAETGESLPNVSFLIGLTRYSSSDDGFAKITVPDFESLEAQSISFSKSGYNPEIESVILKKGAIYPVKMKKEAIVPTVYRCDMQYVGDSSYVDIMNNSVSLSNDNKDIFSLTVTAGYKTGKIINYAIKQDGKTLKSSETGCFENLSASDFKSGKKVMIMVKGENGAEHTYATRLSVYGGDEEVQEALNLGKGISFTIPTEYPIIGQYEVTPHL